MEEKASVGLFGRVLIFVWGALLLAAVGLNIYLMAASPNWLIRLFIFFFLLLPTVYSIYILWKSRKQDSGSAE